jgi:hypothetical protein
MPVAIFFTVLTVSSFFLANYNETFVRWRKKLYKSYSSKGQHDSNLSWSQSKDRSLFEHDLFVFFVSDDLCFYIFSLALDSFQGWLQE